MSAGLTCANPNDRRPGVSITQPESSGNGIARAEVEVCLPLPVTSFTAPVVRKASGAKELTSVDLPTPEWPKKTVLRPDNAALTSVIPSPVF
jgi:hypothetical protein